MKKTSVFQILHTDFDFDFSNRVKELKFGPSIGA